MWGQLPSAFQGSSAASLWSLGCALALCCFSKFLEEQPVEQERSLEGRLASHFHVSPWVVPVPPHSQLIHRTADRSTITNSIPASLVTPLPHQNSTFVS